MSKYDRDLALVTFLALVVITALAFAPPVVLYVAIGVAGCIATLVAFVVIGLRASRRPETPTDRYCAKVDDDVDRKLAEQRMVRRLERQERRRTDGGWRA